MKKDIHPEYFQATVSCAGCGITFETGSTIKEIRVAVCNKCHPFFTGTQRLVDTEGRVDRFKKKYAKFSMARGKPSGEKKADAS